MEEPSRKKLKTTAKFPKTSTGPRITDPRFANIQFDPRYRLPGKQSKVKVDKRFTRVLEDEDFVKRAKVDRYGRPLESNAERKRLKRKYEFDSEEEGKDDEQSDVPDDDGEVQQELSRIEKKTRDPLREGRDSDSEDSSDETTSDEESEEGEAATLEDEVGVGPTQQTDIPTGEVTSRIAIVNLDWDNIRAADLMAVFTSFLPSSGSLLKVSIYPSEFGKERLEREEMEGPPRDIFANPAKEDANEDFEDEELADEDIKNSLLKPDDGTTDFDSTALRRYQIERLRYFYAVLTFSSASVAKQIYDAVDGTEYLRTANFFDLRFVPDDTDFSTDIPREECHTIPDDYRPNEFVTDALQHSKVKLTWDAEDGSRKEAVARAFKGGRHEILENDLKAYLASDGSDDDDEEENEAVSNSKKEEERQRMRTLLGLPPEPEKKASKKDKGPVGGVQITFTSGLSGGSKEKSKKSVFENSPEPEETTLEKYIRKERERKQKRKEKMKNVREGRVPEADATADDNDSGEEQEVPAGNDQEDLGFEDPFFAEPSAASEKAASKKLRKEERLKKKKEREAEEEAERKQRAELELLMADDDVAQDGAAGKRIRHFDMREIQKAEKEERKKNKKKLKAKKGPANGRNDSGNPEDEQDAFKVDTSDPRFSRLFESHEYAIDPTNPKFKGTKAMRALLEEGRRRKHKETRESDEKHSRPELPTGDDAHARIVQRKSDGGANKPDGVSDVKSLVEKIKRRHKS
ncbi:uncharacterized protein Z519_11494 [Cladophialophora bantiana CBS 173.52]|uniref:NUC153 domain-containing protein n=1 Tax=Cladophialophora bantiana (strain ATCC 10958 / CBS 173.52 / CDC B-1940 / NIH 8579) TaxID=1442370 RepID=A0A0D2HTW9_CLAB1|nr:uncharacterized protein Z519_11494 [Cladophialophora bantiana CBS 173.52]KIW87909.1 hypothetical protein Z519_11494 [Cladophialophora bantiana CBS 173.52]